MFVAFTFAFTINEDRNVEVRKKGNFCVRPSTFVVGNNVITT